MDPVIRTVIAGFDASPESKDGLRLAAAIAGACDARLIVASAREYDPVLELPDGEYRAARERVFASIFDEAKQTIGSPFDPRPLDGRPADALHDFAVVAEADLIAVGSTHSGPLGRIYPGSVPHKLMHGAPCPVAVTPARYDAGPLERVGVAFDGRDPSWAAMRFARALATAAGARLELIRVLPTHLVVAGRAVGEAEMRSRCRAQLDEAVAECADSVDTESRLLEHNGGPADSLARAGEDLDLLVAGSRGHGPIGRTMLGSVSASLLRTTRTPVIVVPRPSPEHSPATASMAAAQDPRIEPA